MLGFGFLATPLKAIVGLSFSAGPPNIAPFVMTVIVDAVQRKVWAGPWANGFVEFLKGLKAKLNTSASIPMVVLEGFCITPSPSAFIGRVFWGFRHAVRFFSLGVLRNVFFQKTPAGADESTPNGSAFGCMKFPTITSAEPVILRSLSSFDWPKDGKSSKSFASHVHGSWVKFNKFHARYVGRV